MAFLFLMVVAGNETTTKLLGNAMYWGGGNPDQLTGVYADPTLDSAVDRGDPALRHLQSDSWPGWSSRTSSSTAPPCIAGDTLLLVPGSAHRDERVFERPDEFRIGRDIGSKLLSFGSGAHFCLGAHLARMEARVALTELFERIRGYEVVDVRCRSGALQQRARFRRTCPSR